MPRTRDAPTQPISPATRWFVRIFLFAFLVCAVASVEAWPFTGFRLFSKTRHEIQRTWIAETVGPAGTTSTLWFDELPRAYQDFYLLMPGFRRLPAQRQRGICAAWLSEARRVRPGVASLRIYRVDRNLLPRRGGRPNPPVRSTLEYACS